MEKKILEKSGNLVSLVLFLTTASRMAAMYRWEWDEDEGIDGGKR